MAGGQRILIEDLAAGSLSTVEETAIPGADTRQETAGGRDRRSTMRSGWSRMEAVGPGVNQGILLSDWLNRRNRQDRSTRSNNGTREQHSSEIETQTDLLSLMNDSIRLLG